MSCCGQKREALVNTDRFVEKAARDLVSARVAPPPPAAGPTVTLRMRDRSPMVVQGASGKRYQFHGAGSMQAIDKHDAELLLASGLFERVWG